MLIFEGLNDTETHAMPSFVLNGEDPLEGEGIGYGKIYKIITHRDGIELHLGPDKIDPAAVLAALIHHWSRLIQQNRAGRETYLSLQQLTLADYHLQHALGALSGDLTLNTSVMNNLNEAGPP